MNDALGSPQSVLVLGGGSEIAQATCVALARSRAERIVLAARTPESLDAFADDLRRVGVATVETLAFDATDYPSHQAVIEKAFSNGDIDCVIVAFGLLGDQARDESDGAAAVEIAQTNYTGGVSVLVPVAKRLREQGHGSIVVLSTVAAERARRSNFVYGSSKAGLDAFAQGLGDALAGSGVHVMVVRPGFVHTRMTAGLKAAPLATTPDKVADAIVHGLQRGADTVWVPGALRFVMTGLRHTPRAIFRRLPI